MIKKGEKVHLHNGKVWVAPADGALPKARGRRKTAEVSIRGFVRGALVDPDGTEHAGDWHENTITNEGYKHAIRQFAQLAGSGAASYWGIGYQTNTTKAASDIATQSAFDSTEWGLHSSGGVSRATVSAGTQTLSGTYSLSQSYQYASTQISHAQTVNAIAQHSNSSVGAGSALSVAFFNSSTKGTTQALNVTYNWVFSS